MRRTGLWLAAVWLAAAFAFTLYPFHFSLAIASMERIDWRLWYHGHADRDLVVNLLMLLPLGAGLAMGRRASLARIVLEAALVGFGTGLVIETIQIFEPARFPQLADVVRNGIGCIAGALAVRVLLKPTSR